MNDFELTPYEVDAFIKTLTDIQFETNKIHSEFAKHEDSCGMLMTSSSSLVMNTYLSKLDSDKIAVILNPTLYDESKHENCKFTGNEISVLLTSTALRLHNTMPESQLRQKLFEQYSNTAGQVLPQQSCPVIFSNVLLSVMSQNNKELNELIAKQIDSCLSEEPDQEKRELMAEFNSNLRKITH
ncbi:MAG: hypothetical protein ACPGVT_02375 [Maricaulaceae bacterium]